MSWYFYGGYADPSAEKRLAAHRDNRFAAVDGLLECLASHGGFGGVQRWRAELPVCRWHHEFDATLRLRSNMAARCRWMKIGRWC